jgi:16S rRNA processing protein RimM
MNNADTEYLVVGKLGAAYGIKGWLKVSSFTNPLSNIGNYNPWYLKNGEHWEPIEVTDSREHGKSIVAKLKGLNNPEQARLFTGKEVAIKRSQLPVLAKDEYYWSDLEGLTVINQRNEVLGKVTHLMATGANDVLVVKGEKEHAIPYLQGDVVKQIDLTAKTMHVDWEVI